MRVAKKRVEKECEWRRESREIESRERVRVEKKRVEKECEWRRESREIDSRE